MEQREAVEAVGRMQDYIHANLQSPITLRDLARAAGYSQWYSARLFKDIVGKTPFEYLRSLRLSRAALVLRDQQPKVVDVALDFVFDSHEGFTRAFFRQFGVLPKKYSSNPEPIQLFMPYSVRARYLRLEKGDEMMTEKVNAVFVQVVERPARKLILKRGRQATNYFAYCDEVGCEVWGMLSSIKEAMYEPAGMWLPPNMLKPGTSTYVQGVEVAADYSGKVPDGFEIIDLPACKLLVFQGPPFANDKFGEAIGQLWEVMKQYNPEIYGYQWADEDGPRIQLEPQGYRGYIEARPVRPLNL